jgi:hypothetical protein
MSGDGRLRAMKKPWLIVVVILCLSGVAYGGLRYERQRRFENALAESRQRLRMAFAHRDDEDSVYFDEWEKSEKKINPRTEEQLTAWGDLYSCGASLKTYREWNAIGLRADAGKFEREAAVCVTP